MTGAAERVRGALRFPHPVTSTPGATHRADGPDGRPAAVTNRAATAPVLDSPPIPDTSAQHRAGARPPAGRQK